MSSHDRYLELGTLAAIGQISADEDRELSQHLLECAECRETCSDYSAILHRYLPNASPVRFRLKNDFVHTDSAAEIRERFLARARSEGAQFSADVESPKPARPILTARPSWIGLGWAAAVSAAAVAAVSFVTWTSSISERRSESETAVQIASLTRLNELLNHSVRDARKPIAPRIIAVPERDVERERALEAQLQVITAQLRDSNGRAAELENRLALLLAENTTLASARDKNQVELQQIQKELAREKDSSRSATAGLLEALDKNATLNAKVKEEAQRLAMEQQLRSVSSDVRQLMGARNLHIIDVHDVSASGQSTKSFGRVFYSEGQSLVFYAFDLPTSKSKYYFRAWGQREANEQSVRNLGVFTVDDHEQRRWVLKINDPQLLQSIDSAFVTAEASDDSLQPKGKRILYAYLAGPANHP